MSRHPLRHCPAVLALAALCAAPLGIGGTAAFTTAALQTHNVITAGSAQIILADKYQLDGAWVDWPATGIDGALPGQTVSKLVYVQNTGSVPVWVRIAATPTVSVATSPVPDPELYMNYVYVAGETRLDSYNTADWTRGADGAYYCNAPLPPGDSTPPLFTGVYLNPDTLDERFRGGRVEVALQAQAAQSENNPGSAVWPPLP